MGKRSNVTKVCVLCFGGNGDCSSEANLTLGLGHGFPVVLGTFGDGDQLRLLEGA